MNENDIAFLNALADPRAPFLDIARAIYRANRLMCDSAREVLMAQLNNIQDALNIPDPLDPQNVHREIWPKADTSDPWGYEGCGAGARVWLPNSVGATLWLFVEFGDENNNRIVAGLEFNNPTRRRRWIEQFAERPGFDEATWEGFALARYNPLAEFAALDDALAQLLQAYLTEIRRVRVLNQPQELGSCG